MNIDHGEFIARHHKSASGEAGEAPASADISARVSGWFFSFVFVLFVGVVGFVVLHGPWESYTRNLIVLGLTVILFVGTVFMYLYRLSRSRGQEIELIREAMEASRGARLITDSANVTLYFNQKFQKLCRGLGAPGYASLVRLFENNSEAKAHFHVLADQAHRGLTDTIELFSKLEDSERWLAVTAQPIPGRAGCIHWRIDDVTQKHKLESAIRDEREKLIDFTDNAPVGFFSVNEHGRFVFANATFARWLGEDLQYLLERGELHTYLVHPPQGALPFDLTEDGRTRQIVEVPMKGAGGKIFLASINHVVVKETDGQVRTRAVVHDMTAQREMSLALKASEDRFQRFFDEAPVGIIQVDTQGQIADCNAAFAAMLGRSSEEIEGVDFKTLIAGEEDARNDILSQISKIEEGQQLGAPLEISLKSHKGAIETQMHARKFKTGGDAVLHFIDLSEKKALEAQFVQSQKMQAIGQLAGGIAHDFNNLLTAIIGFCDLLLLRHKPGDPSFGDIMQIKQNSNRAANLVRQLLAFSRQQTLRPRVHDVGEILTEVSHLLRRLIGAGIELELVHGSGIHPVKVDEGQMEQVLINLAVNARDAMSGNGKLIIETQNFTTRQPLKLLSEEMPHGHWILITVTDTGCGIAKKNLTRIFEPFFTTKAVGEGTGLGLATVYGIIRQTGGYLDVESEVDQGTSFKIYLPRATEADKEEQTDTGRTEELADNKDLTGTERILLVEDEDAVRTFSQRALSNKGYEVITAENGDSALNVFQNLENKKIDLLVTDVVMPGMDGPTLAKKLRDMSPTLKIIFMSGYTEDKLKDYMGENIFFLPKPFTLKQLAAKVKDVLEG